MRRKQTSAHVRVTSALPRKQTLGLFRPKTLDRLDRDQKWASKCGTPQDRADLNLLTAASVSLERLHLCCKGSCEFVESSLRTVLLRHRPGRFFLLGKNRNRATASSKIFQNRNAHLCRRGQNQRPGNGDFDDTPPALHPPFYGAVGRGSGSRFIAAAFLRFF